LLNCQLSSDVLSAARSTICTLLAYVLALTFHEETAASAADLIVCLTSLQCAIRSQILATPVQSEEFDSEVCRYVARHFTASQVFEIITGLLSVFASDRLLPQHAFGVVFAVRGLLRERGRDEFLFDAQILRDLLGAITGRADDVVDEVIAIFELLLSLRQFSVLSIFITQSGAVSQELFERLVHAERGLQLLAVLAGAFADDDSQTALVFAGRALPLLGGLIEQISDDTWTKFMVGVSLSLRWWSRGSVCVRLPWCCRRSRS
jgi:hypothetical protein